MDLSALVASVLLKFEYEVKIAKCEVQYNGEPGVVGFWDPFRIEEVILNLLLNAMKYGSGKPVEISVSRTDGQAVLAIRDHGIGIAREDQVRIFNRFERAVSYKHFGGMGLGLYISREIVIAHGGKISVQSEPAVGSTFTMTLPL